jgi:hypothetical protein
MKQCVNPTCRKILPITEFGKDKNRSDGLNVYCKECIRMKGRKANLTLEQHVNNIQRKNKAKKDNPLSSKLSDLRSTDIRAGREFNLKVKDVIEIVKLQNNTNIYTNTPIYWVRTDGTINNSGDHFSSTVDRIDSTKGHIIGNIQIMEVWINRMKSDYTTKTFEKILTRIMTSEHIMNYNLEMLGDFPNKWKTLVKSPKYKSYKLLTDIKTETTKRECNIYMKILEKHLTISSIIPRIDKKNFSVSN